MLHGEGREEVLLPVGDHALHLQADVQAWVGVGGVGEEVCEGGYQQWMKGVCVEKLKYFLLIILCLPEAFTGVSVSQVVNE